MKPIILPAAALLLALGACSGKSDQADAQADQLDNAAEQSTPEAADVLHNQADQIRDNGAVGDPARAGSSTQNAMDAAGNAQATNTTR